MVDKIVNNEANNRRIVFVEQCFGNSGQPLAMLGRILVGEGVLTKMCRKKLKPRQFFLFNDLLVYGNIVISKKMYNKQRVLSLESVRIVSVPDGNDADLWNGFQIISPSKSFTVYAACPSEKEEWMRHVQKCIDMTKQGRHQNEVENSPVWVPDHIAPVCMHCGKSEFSVINRRHHCRKCGAVCCSACTDKRWILPHVSQKPVRVCRTCFIGMKISSSTPATTPATADSLQNTAEDSSNSEDDSEGSNVRCTDQASFYDNRS